MTDAALQEELVTQPLQPTPPAGEPQSSQAGSEPAAAETPALPTLAPGTTIEGYTIVELRDEQAGVRTYRAQAPNDVCAQCGARATDPEARFCEECGAELLPRDVLLVEQPQAEDAAVTGAALATTLPDDPIRALLPPITAIEQEGRRLLVVEEAVPGWQSLAELLSGHGDAPDQPAALEEADALPIALQLAQLIQYLHRNQIALGDLSLAQLLIGPQQRIRLRDIDSLRPLNDASRQADLLQLHHTLEDLTRTPRETRKLDMAAVEESAAAPRTLQDVLALARIGGLADADAWVTALSGLSESQRAIAGLTVQIGARSNVGMVRELNEDSLMTLDLKLDIAGRAVNAGLYVVADGMGGHAAGEVASSLAVQSMANIVSQTLMELTVDSSQGLTDAQLGDLARQAAERANLAVYEEGRRRGNDMGTTLTFALVVGDRGVIGNVGDSRTYLLRNGQLQRISKDHSLVQRLVDMGQIQPDEVYTHPHRNAILRSLGEKPQIELDLFPLRLQPGDIVFCCSDGQWEMVRDPQMNEIIVKASDVQAAADQLIAEGNRNGGEDNITAVLVRFA
jgi:protein phosphatase